MAEHNGEDPSPALVQLSHAYAAAVDDRDLDALGALFTPDAALVTPRGRRDGWDQIRTAMGRLSDYDATFHLVGQVVTWSDPDGVWRGETYCQAHHFWTEADQDHDRVLYLRYQDTFAPEPWRFAARELHQVREQEIVTPTRSRD